MDNIFKYHWIEQFIIHDVKLTEDKILEFYDKFGYFFTKNHTKEYLIEAWKWINNNESEL